MFFSPEAMVLSSSTPTLERPAPPSAGDALLVIDVQYDFCPGGNLAVGGGDEVIAPVNRLSRAIPHVILTQDWHPRGHLSFASSHPGRNPFDTVRLDYGEQVLWPDHCVQGSHGAEIHAGLELDRAELVLRKGFRREIDSYSAFFENDRATPTGLAGYLRERGIGRVFIAGLAFDFCVRWTAEDARRLGFCAIVIEDACRAIDSGGSLAAAHSALSRAGVSVVRAAELAGG